MFPFLFSTLFLLWDQFETNDMWHSGRSSTVNPSSQWARLELSLDLSSPIRDGKNGILWVKTFFLWDSECKNLFEWSAMSCCHNCLRTQAVTIGSWLIISAMALMRLQDRKLFLEWMAIRTWTHGIWIFFGTLKFSATSWIWFELQFSAWLHAARTWEACRCCFTRKPGLL